MKPFAKIQTTDREKNQIQENIKQAMQPIVTNPMSGGAFLKPQHLIAGTTTIPHGLGRMQQGWIVSDVDAAAKIYRAEAFNSDNLVLVSDAAVTVVLYVF